MDDVDDEALLEASRLSIAATIRDITDVARKFNHPTTWEAPMNTIVLAEPLMLTDGSALSEITVRRARVRDLKAVQKAYAAADQETALVARLTGLVPHDLEELLVSDYQRVLEAIFPGHRVDPGA